MKRDKFQEVKDAASAYNAAIYLAFSDDSNIHNPHRKSVWAALENIYPLTKLQTCDWCEELRKETMDNLLTIHPDNRPLVMKETIHGLFDSFEKSYWLSDLTKIEGMETLDVSLYSYGVKIMDCLIPDHYSVDEWRISEMNEDVQEYLECIGILAQDMMAVLQDIVGKGSFEARDGITGLSLFGDDSQTTLPDQLNTTEAKKYWSKAIKKGFVNEDYSFNGTKYQMTYFAENFSMKLGLKNKWKPFVELWHFKYFPQTKRESKERIGYVARQNEIDQIFED